MSAWFDFDLSANWVRDRTIVRCYDADNKEIAVLDGASGLRWVLEETESGLRATVDDSVLPPGRWVFDGVYLTGGTDGTPLVTHVVHAEGVAVNDGSGYWQLVAELAGQPGSPWYYDGAAVWFATYAEREERLAICHECPLYLHGTGECSVDMNFMPSKTINAHESCPEGKWGIPDWWTTEDAQARLAAAAPPSPITPEDQAAFEAEWEARSAD